MAGYGASKAVIGSAGGVCTCLWSATKYVYSSRAAVVSSRKLVTSLDAVSQQLDAQTVALHQVSNSLDTRSRILMAKKQRDDEQCHRLALIAEHVAHQVQQLRLGHIPSFRGSLFLWPRHSCTRSLFLHRSLV